MARKNPIGKIKDAALETIKDPVGTATRAAGQAVGQVAGTVELGRTVAGQVTKGAADVVASRLPGRKPGTAKSEPSESSEPTPAGGSAAEGTPGANLRAVPSDGPSRPHGDPVEPILREAAKKTPAKKAPAKKAPAKKAAAETAAAKKAAPAKATPAKATPAKAAPAKATPAKSSATKATAKKTTAKKTPAPTTAIDAAADTEHVDVTPADVAKQVAKSPTAKKTTVKKSAAKKTATKSAAKKSSSPSGRLPAKKAPLSAAELAAGAGTETITPVGTRGADAGTNPDTTEKGLQQVDTPPLVDSSTTKAVASEAETLGRASDTDKG